MMKRTPFNPLHLMICAVLSIILLYPEASPAKTCDSWAAKVVSVQGMVEVKQRNKRDDPKIISFSHHACNKFEYGR